MREENKMSKKTKSLYTIAKKSDDKILVIKGVIVEYDDSGNSTEHINKQIESIEKGYGGGCVWSDTYLSMNMCTEPTISDIKEFGFEENLKLMMGMDKTVVYLVDNCRPDEMTVDQIIDTFTKYETDHTPQETESVPNIDDEVDRSLTDEELIESEFNEIMELVDCRRQAKKILFRYKSDSELFQSTKKYIDELKKEINRRFGMYDKKIYKEDNNE
jgi:hypothetical protein